VRIAQLVAVLSQVDHQTATNCQSIAKTERARAEFQKRADSLKQDGWQRACLRMADLPEEVDFLRGKIRSRGSSTTLLVAIASTSSNDGSVVYLGHFRRDKFKIKVDML
jgi:hypothetical protein